jgi:propanediol dehydratase large subunit
MTNKVGHFQVCAEMAKRGLDIRMSLLENITNLRYSNKTKGTSVTIAVDGNLCSAIAYDNKFVGGLLLCDREQYMKLAAELSGKEQ